jgi:hypothetical protein
MWKNVLIFTILKYIVSDLYTPYKNQINSIFGTGDTGIDHLYRNRCKEICLNCCEGDIAVITCATAEQCESLQSQIDIYLYTLIASVYFSILIVTASAAFVVFYLLSRKVYDKGLSFKNGAVAAILTLFTGLIVPLIILKIISVVKNQSMTSLLGGDFKGLNSNLISTRIKANERHKKYMVEESDSENRQPDVVSKRVLNLDGRDTYK